MTSELPKPAGSPFRQLSGDLLLSALVALVVFGAIQWWQGRDINGRFAMGEEAPNFELVDNQSGKTIALKDLRGRPVVLNFWATWCEPCRAEMPELDRLSRSAGKQLHVISISADDSVLVRRFLRNGGYQLTCLMDASGAVSEEYKVVALPRTIVLDGEGRVVWDVEGQVDLNALRATLRSVGG